MGYALFRNNVMDNTGFSSGPLGVMLKSLQALVFQPINILDYIVYRFSIGDDANRIRIPTVLWGRR